LPLAVIAGGRRGARGALSAGEWVNFWLKIGAEREQNVMEKSQIRNDPVSVRV
jgi:hypothetical protein